MIITGEASGDLHGATLSREILIRCPDLHISGMGGSKMRASGVEIIHDISDIAVIGIWEVLINIPKYYRLLKYLTLEIIKRKPMALILIDFPDFNMRLAKYAKKNKIPVIYYISPQVWAWRKGRIKEISKLVEKMIVIFPFEVELYKRAGVDVEFVGHPIVDWLKDTPSPEEIRKNLNIRDGELIVGLLPGSRFQEIKRHLDVLLKSAEILRNEIKDIRFLIPIAPTIEMGILREEVKKTSLNIQLLPDMSHEVISIADLIIAASGTASLEACYFNTPMVIIYRLSEISYIMGKILVNLPYISLANILAEKEVVSELIQRDANPERIATEALKLLGNKKQLKDLKNIAEKLGPPGASARAANIIVDFIKGKAA